MVWLTGKHPQLDMEDEASASVVIHSSKPWSPGLDIALVWVGEILLLQQLHFQSWVFYQP